MRAPWRILVFIGLCIACILVAVAITGLISRIPGMAALATADNELDVVLGLVAAHAVMLRWVDEKSWTFVGMGRDSVRGGLLSEGTLVGALAIGIPSLLLIASNQLEPVAAREGSSSAAALSAAVTLLPAAAAEELLMRGYIFAVIRESVGWKLALISTSVVFGLLHMANPGAEALSILIVIIAGFFLGGVLLATGSLAAVTLAHFAWNWTMAALLHTPVSGIGLSAPDYRVVDSGPDWLTGGQWGPEGGVAAAAGMFAGFFYLYARRIRRLES